MNAKSFPRLKPRRQAAGGLLARWRKRRAIAAYTVMEVMMALGVLSVGATGVIALQKATIIGNVRARDLATANSVASAWMERLRMDSMAWKGSADGTSTIAGTQWLNIVGNDFPTVAGGEGNWQRPAAVGDYAPVADVRGKDIAVASTITPEAFCTNIRLTQLAPTLIRAEVRVFWLRRRGGGTLSGATLCSNDPSYLSGIEGARDRYHFVYVATGILRNDAD